VTKPMFGLLLGGVLGIFDGLSALISAPNDPAIKAGIVGIVVGSTIKGLIAGVLTGWYAARTQSLVAGIAFGLSVGLVLAYLVCLMQKMGGQNPYYWQIMLPGAILGAIVGYATMTFRGRRPAMR
jgi:hypothetical protein